MTGRWRLWYWMCGLDLPDDGTRTRRVFWVFGGLGFVLGMLVSIVVPGWSP